MLPPGAVAKVVNSHLVKEIKVIQAFRQGVRPAKAALMGDVIVGVVKKIGSQKQSFLRSRRHIVNTGQQYKRGDIVRAVVVRSKKERPRGEGNGKRIHTGIYLSFPKQNEVFLLGSNAQDNKKRLQSGPHSLKNLALNKGFKRTV